MSHTVMQQQKQRERERCGKSQAAQQNRAWKSISSNKFSWLKRLNLLLTQACSRFTQKAPFKPKLTCLKLQKIMKISFERYGLLRLDISSLPKIASSSIGINFSKPPNCILKKYPKTILFISLTLSHEHNSDPRVLIVVIALVYNHHVHNLTYPNLVQDGIQSIIQRNSPYTPMKLVFVGTCFCWQRFSSWSNSCTNDPSSKQ